MVIVLLIAPNSRGFKSILGVEFLRAIQIRSKTSFGGKVTVPCRRFLRHVKEPYRYEKTYL
jgi:hypothetical protein